VPVGWLVHGKGDPCTERIHFISGLPRSGSTWLAALRRQNPRFHVGMSRPLAGMFGALLVEKHMSAGVRIV
jgi:hypothetical protein